MLGIIEILSKYLEYLRLIFEDFYLSNLIFINRIILHPYLILFLKKKFNNLMNNFLLYNISHFLNPKDYELFFSQSLIIFYINYLVFIT